MIYIGIDAGKSGFVSIHSGDSWRFFPLEVDSDGDIGFSKIAERFKSMAERFPPNECIVTLEKLWSRATDTPMTAFGLGVSYGAVKQALATNGYTYNLVAPITWQKKMHNKEDGENTKERSINMCKKLYPNVDMRKNSRCSKPHDGKADSMLICLYGEMINKK